MTSDRQLDLIARGIDGDLTGEEQQAFEALIVEDAEAGALHRRLGELDRALHEIDATEPPPEIREYVMARVRGRAYGRTTAMDRMRTVMDGLLDVLRARPAYGVALGMAVVALMLLPVALHYGPGGGTPDQVAGTLTTPIGTDGLTNALTIRGTGLAGTVTSWLEDRTRTLNIDLEASTPVTMTIHYDASAFAPTDLEQSFAGMSYSLVQQGQITVVDLRSGHYAVALDEIGSTSDGVSIEFSRHGESLYTGVVAGNQERR